ncbi:uncharacterized protein METZ01_LOCUS207838 [marine metagenome]|jgi:hypothetical protein|uniref:Uncharacterized protein n=1 Tax=marine metagenome TaxID=408172 RepID=A0A382EY11_9ZZZZ
MTVPIHNEDSIMRDIRQTNTGKGLRIVRTIPLDMDVPSSRRNVDVCSENFGNNVRWLLRNLGVRNSEHPQFSETVKKLKILAKKIKI